MNETEERFIKETEMLRRQVSEAEKLYQTLVQTNLYGIQEVDIYGNITYTNSVQCEILAYSGGELKGKQIWQLLASDFDRSKLKEHLTKLTQGETVPPLWVGRYLKKRKKRAKAEIAELQQSWTYRQDEKGRVIRFVSLTTDIINYKQAQRGGAEGEEERYRLIVEAAGEMILTFDIYGRITYVNEKTTKTLGYFEEELLAMSIEDILPSDQLEKIEEELLNRHDDGKEKLVLHKAEFVDRNLKTLPVRISSSLIIKENEPADILIIAHDLHQMVENGDESAQAQAIPDKTKETDFLITECARELIMTFDMEGRITYVNQGGEELSGYFKEELMDMNIADLVPPDYLGQLQKKNLSESVTENREIMIFEAALINRELKLIPVEISSSLIIKDGGKPSDILIIARDLTQRRKTEKEFLRVEKFESLATLAGGFTDDLNNLLTGIMGNIDLAQINLEPGGKIHEILSYAKESCINIKDLTRQFVIFSKGGTIIRKTGSLANLIRDTANSVISGSNVASRFFIPDDLWLAAFDEKYMRQVISNLISNAVEAMPGGGQIKIHAENITIPEGSKNGILTIKSGDYIKISVRNQGAGIREEDIGKIFDPYFSTKNTGEQKRRGLGLTTAYSVIKKHHGYIDVSSVPGSKTIFDIYIPASNKKKLPKKIKKKTKKQPVLDKGRILIMDDEDIVIDVACHMLNELGYDVAFSKNGDEATKSYQNAMSSGKPFDVVILDLHVKGGAGGKQVLKKLIKIDPYVKGIAASGYSNDPEMADFEKYGFSGAMEKPYSINELSIILNDMMEQMEHFETIEVLKSDWIDEQGTGNPEKSG